MTTPEAGSKAGLRREALARRDALDPAERAAASATIAARVLALADLAASRCVAAYWPIRSEVDPRPVLDALAVRGQVTALPVVTPDGLVFRAWAPGDGLARAGFGLAEPEAGAPAATPDALLVPLAAFDATGHRIGYGRGYYDRAIAALAAAGPLLTVGLAFAAQEIAAVPAAPHDRALDAVATERALLVPARAGAKTRQVG